MSRITHDTSTPEPDGDTPSGPCRPLEPRVADAHSASHPDSASDRRDLGQATTEYALILLAAALVAVLVIGWATAGGGAAAIGRLFDTAINAAIDQLG